MGNMPNDSAEELRKLPIANFVHFAFYHCPENPGALLCCVSCASYVACLCVKHLSTSMESNVDTGGIVPCRIPPQNIVQRLMSRELNASRRHSCNALSTAHIFFTNIFPNYTVINVEKPACFLRKFSPDGHHLIAFSADQTSLEIYEFCGTAAAADMLDLLPTIDGATDVLPDNVEVPAATRVRAQLFSRFFKLKKVTSIAVSGESLNRECSLFTSDGRLELSVTVYLYTRQLVPKSTHPHG